MDVDVELVNSRFPSLLRTMPTDVSRPNSATANSHSSDRFVEFSETLMDSVLWFSREVSVTVISSDMLFCFSFCVHFLSKRTVVQ